MNPLVHRATSQDKKKKKKYLSGPTFPLAWTLQLSKASFNIISAAGLYIHTATLLFCYKPSAPDLWRFRNRDKNRTAPKQVYMQKYFKSRLFRICLFGILNNNIFNNEYEMNEWLK